MTAPIVSIQLYTVRDFAGNDVKGTLQKIKDMGYDYVEPAGTYNMPVHELRAMLDEIGLCAYSAHVPFSLFEKDLQGTVEAYKVLGCKVIAIPFLERKYLPEGELYDRTKEIFVKLAKLCNEADIKVAYHNHSFEFEVMPNGDYLLDRLFHELPQIFAELDTGWIMAAGLSPHDYIRKYKGRCPLIHLKDTVKVGDGFEDRPVGEGSQDIPAAIEAALDMGAVGFVVELDQAHGISSLEAAQRSREFLKKLGY